MSLLRCQDNHGNIKSRMVRKWVESVRGIQQEDPLVPPWGKYEATSNDCLAPGAVDETAGFSNIAIATTEIADTEVASDPVGYPFERERKGRSQPPEQEEEGEHSRDEHAQELHSILHRIGQLKADFASTIKFLDQRVVELQNKFGGATNQTTKPGNRVQNDAPFSYGFTWEKIRDDWLSWVWSLARGEKTPPDQPTGRPQKRRLSRQSQQSNRCFVSRFKKDKLKTATEADFVLIAQSGAAAHKQEADCRSDAEQYFSLCNKRRPALENFTSSFHSAFTLLYGVSPESISPFLQSDRTREAIDAYASIRASPATVVMPAEAKVALDEFLYEMRHFRAQFQATQSDSMAACLGLQSVRLDTGQLQAKYRILIEVLNKHRGGQR